MFPKAQEKKPWSMPKEEGKQIRERGGGWKAFHRQNMRLGKGLGTLWAPRCFDDVISQCEFREKFCDQYLQIPKLWVSFLC